MNIADYNLSDAPKNSESSLSAQDDIISSRPSVIMNISQNLSDPENEHSDAHFGNFLQQKNDHFK
jgi:hypothetical protein